MFFNNKKTASNLFFAINSKKRKLLILPSIFNWICLIVGQVFIDSLIAMGPLEN